MEIDAEVLTTGVGSGIIISREQQFFSDLKAGKINVQLDAKNQEKHIISDKRKNNAKQQHLKIISGDTTTGNPKSCLFREMDPQTLISKYAGTGRLVFDDLHGIVNEFIEIGYLVGLTYERRLKKFIRSTTLQIKYTKAGVHIFPTKRWDRGD